MKLLTLVISVVGIACCAALLAFTANRPSPTTLKTALTDTHFINHLAKYSKSYASMEEYSMRAGIFAENLEKIRQLNSDAENNVTFDVNHLADWTAEEYKGLLGFRKSPIESPSNLLTDDDADMPADTLDDADMPTELTEYSDMPDIIDESFSSIPGALVDWRNKGVLNPPFGLDQG